MENNNTNNQNVQKENDISKKDIKIQILNNNTLNINEIINKNDEILNENKNNLNDNKLYEQRFEKLQELQSLIKKESAMKELCK
jgi:hypothetical protein